MKKLILIVLAITVMACEKEEINNNTIICILPDANCEMVINGYQKKISKTNTFPSNEIELNSDIMTIRSNNSCRCLIILKNNNDRTIIDIEQNKTYTFIVTKEHIKLSI